MTNLDARVAELERELGIVNPAEQGEIEKQRAAAAEEAKEIRRRLLARLRSDEQDVLALVGDFQHTAELLVEQLVEIRKLRERQRVHCGELATWVPSGLASGEVDRRLGGYLAELLWQNSNRRNRIGNLRLEGVGGLFRDVTDWVESESQIMREHIKALGE